MRTKKRLLCLLLALALICTLVPLTAASAATGVITVTDENTGATAQFDYAALARLAAAEGNKTYDYSSYNQFPSWKLDENIKGVSVEALFVSIGVSLVSLDDDLLITVSARDGYTRSVTINDVIDGERYYFPHGNNGTANGASGGTAARIGKKTVPGLLALYADTSEAKFMLGQKEPNEQTYNDFVSNMMGGSITLKKEHAKELTAPVVKTDKASAFVIGDKIELVLSDGSHSKIYYTTDGSEPDLRSTMYNISEYKAQGGPEDNVPVITGFPFIIRAFAYARGVDESEETTFASGGEWVKDEGKTYYRVNGKNVTGHAFIQAYRRGNKLGVNEYQFNEDGSLYSGFAKSGDKWYYYQESGSSPASSAYGQKIKNWYTTAKSGYMTAAEQLRGRVYNYYFDANGAMYTGWRKTSITGNRWMYFGESGSKPSSSRLGRQARYGTQRCVGNGGGTYTYMFYSTGPMFTGRNQIGHFCETGDNPAKDMLGMLLGD